LLGGSLAAALSVGIASEVLARLHHEGAVIFSVPGMIPLVPGTTVYWASLALLEGRIPDAVILTADMLRFALGIAGGLACATRLAGICTTMLLPLRSRILQRIGLPDRGPG
jgi:uncharacterized membrane protein YjjB (DUF3815 family)